MDILLRAFRLDDEKQVETPSSLAITGAADRTLLVNSLGEPIGYLTATERESIWEVGIFNNTGAHLATFTMRTDQHTNPIGYIKLPNYSTIGTVKKGANQQWEALDRTNKPRFKTYRDCAALRPWVAPALAAAAFSLEYHGILAR